MKTRLLFVLWVGLMMAENATIGASSGPVFQMRLVAASDNGSTPPADTEKAQVTHVDPSTGRTNQEVLYLGKAVLLNDKDVKEASVVSGGPSGQPEISIILTDAGRKRFAEVTRQNIGKRLAIMMDGVVYSAPVIRSEIPGGKAIISGNFTQKEADELSEKINAALKKARP